MKPNKPAGKMKADNPIICDLMEKFYAKAALAMVESENRFLFGEIIGYRKHKETKYLHLPILTLEKHYDNDSEYGTGELEGILLSIRWVKTFIPIGTEIIKEPIYRKPKGVTIKFQRYSKLFPRKKER